MAARASDKFCPYCRTADGSLSRRGHRAHVESCAVRAFDAEARRIFAGAAAKNAPLNLAEAKPDCAAGPSKVQCAGGGNAPPLRAGRGVQLVTLNCGAANEAQLLVSVEKAGGPAALVRKAAAAPVPPPQPAPHSTGGHMECPVCGLRLLGRNFAAHYRVHTGQLPHTCPSCPMRFRTTSQLRVHRRAHTGERPYACAHDGCPYACTTRANLNRHVRTHHGGGGEPGPKRSVFSKSIYRPASRNAERNDSDDSAEDELVEETLVPDDTYS